MENNKLTDEQIKQFENLYENMYIKVKDVINIIGNNGTEAYKKFEQLDKKSKEHIESKETSVHDGMEIYSGMAKELGIMTNSKVLVEEIINSITSKKINCIIKNENKIN